MIADKAGIVKIEYGGDGPTDTNHKRTRETDEPSNCAQNGCHRNQHIEICKQWLQQYFTDPSKILDVEQPALSMRLHQSKPFLVKVWQILRQNSKPGMSITYGRLATLAGNPKAVRSVGLAMRRNPFPLIVPCHRVIKADAKIGNYSWLKGRETKKWLLDHERGFCNGNDKIG